MFNVQPDAPHVNKGGATSGIFLPSLAKITASMFALEIGLDLGLLQRQKEQNAITR